MDNKTGLDKWTINRIGLINFWLYDEETFDFFDGRLLLRGSNGSGKSVTMQSFIPLLLDGNKSPERLDPFGSRARRLENYLLGEDGGQEENTGYLYMELKKPRTGVLITIGMGLRARKGKALDFWGFAITDGRRVGEDFFLYKNMGDKIPLTRTELKNRIAAGGEVMDGQGDYMAMVNRLLFGFETLEEYDEMIKLLVQLRTPKLSKDFKPTVIYEIMNNSLQPLSDEELRPMSEAIENMDGIKVQLDVLKEGKKAADRLMQEYQRYNRFILWEKAQSYAGNHSKLSNALKEAAQLEAEGQEHLKRHQDSEEEGLRLKQRQAALEHRREQLRQHDSFKAHEEVDKIRLLLLELEEDHRIKGESVKGKRERERLVNGELKRCHNESVEQEEKLDQVLLEMNGLAETLKYDAFVFMEKELRDSLTRSYSFKLHRGETDKLREQIVQARKALEQEKTASLAYDKALAQVEQTRREKESARREFEKNEGALSDVKTRYVEEVYGWEGGNSLLKLSPERLQELNRAVWQYGGEGTFDDIVKEARDGSQIIENGFHREIAEREAVRVRLEEQLEEKKRELEQWKAQIDPEPLRSPKVEANRNRLAKAGIPHLPVYMAVDFREYLDEACKGRIEESLLDLGILDALIVPEEYKDKVMDMDPDMGDRYLFARPLFFTNDSSALLRPVAPESGAVTGEHIDNVLKSIQLEYSPERLYIGENGEYGMGMLQGRASHCYTPRFLGVEARRNYRRENIARVEEEISALMEKRGGEAAAIAFIKERVAQLRLELKAFPAKEGLEEAYRLLKEAEFHLEVLTRELISKEGSADKLYAELKAVRGRVYELTAKMELSVTLEAYEEAEEAIGQYRDNLSDLENKHIKLLECQARVQSLTAQLDGLSEDLDALFLDLRKLQSTIQENKDKKQNFEALLKELHFDEIKVEIESCLKELSLIPNALEEAIRSAQTNKEQMKAAQEKLEAKKKDILLLQKGDLLYRECFAEEYVLGYVLQEETQDFLKTARHASQALSGGDRAQKTREDYGSSLQERYHEIRHHLTEYNLIMEHRFSDSRGEEELSEAIAPLRKRLDFRARVQGKSVDFMTLASTLAESIEENEKLLRESDRQLFEDILANTVGKKIRDRIYHSEQWVKKMNGLMEGMNTSSGLSFSLSWKNRVAETEEQMDTRALVDLLKSDAGLLNESQMDRLSSHFRSKIALARKAMEDKGAFQATFHTIMKEILDYRKWFEFQLFYVKTGEQRRELTNNAFDRFSGGEKAMAMYVPLFSSVYARYEGGRADCPRIISLDEAFAGVDENNIRDMFKLIEELRFNFIINSQILWGDYDTVPRLSICELIRPNNADFVSVIRYGWNGSTKSLLSSGDIKASTLKEGGGEA